MKSNKTYGRMPYKQGVTGSNPVTPTNKKGSATLNPFCFTNQCISFIFYSRHLKTNTISVPPMI